MGPLPTGSISLRSPSLKVGLTAAAFLLLAPDAPAFAQDYQLCVKLEARLVQLDRESRGGGASASQYRTAIDEAQRRLTAARREAERAGCGKQQGFLFFRPPRTLSCLPFDEDIDRLEANLRNMQARASGAVRPSSSAIASERRNILAMLGENRCGPKYERYGTQQRAGMFLRDYTRDPYMQNGTYRDGAALYGNGSGFYGSGRGFYGTYRTLCVRACDGYYWPISFSTVESRFGYDQQLCQRSCPGANVALFVHRNPGEGPNQAISLAGQPYSMTPNAFRYRDEYVSDCTCKGGVQTAALGYYQQGGRVSVDLAARDGTLPPRDYRLANPQLPPLEPAVTDVKEAPVATKVVRLTPVPRPRPGNEVPVAGSIATLTGQEDFLAVAAPVRARAPDGKSIRVVGPGSTLYRSAGE